uniref:Uncharacterized protein n=1 Tax=Heterorhabditis bacteriophora TaxID=37862 RepID=A0A1I7XBH5_HETBA
MPVLESSSLVTGMRLRFEFPANRFSSDSSYCGTRQILKILKLSAQFGSAIERAQDVFQQVSLQLREL